MPPRSPKMKRRIFGFQRRVWWPKWTPASRSSRMLRLPRVPLSVVWCGSPAGARWNRRSERRHRHLPGPPGRGRKPRQCTRACPISGVRGPLHDGSVEARESPALDQLADAIRASAWELALGDRRRRSARRPDPVASAARAAWPARRPARVRRGAGGRARRAAARAHAAQQARSPSGAASTCASARRSASRRARS